MRCEKIKYSSISEEIKFLQNVFFFYIYAVVVISCDADLGFLAFEAGGLLGEILVANCSYSIM